MIYAFTNRSISGIAPSKYIQKLCTGLQRQSIQEAIETHKIDFTLLDTDSFDSFIIDRAKALLTMIEKAIGKSVAGREAQETIDAFGSTLL